MSKVFPIDLLPTRQKQRAHGPAGALTARSHSSVWAAVLLASLLGRAVPSPGANLPDGFTEVLFAEGLANVTAMEFAPDGRLFVCEQDGAVRVVRNGVLQSTPFLPVTTDPGGERGLLGIAFDPGFAGNNFVYVYYTATSPTIHNRVSRFTADGDVAQEGSEVSILDLETLNARNHNGGAIHFGLDGKLYVAVGENAVISNSQSLSNRLGKMLRINPDGSAPADNPFVEVTTPANGVIWALGLRNPYTFAIQPGTGRIFINDVGAGSYEEVNEGMPGANYGWPNCEGPCAGSATTFVDPLFQYTHGIDPTNGCAITGGTFYNPGTVRFPRGYLGSYFFADTCGDWIRRLDPANGNAVSDFATGVPGPVDLKTGPDGRLYYLARSSGQVWAVDFTNGPPVLEIARNEEKRIVIQWPASATGYLLESTDTVGATNWDAVTAPIVVTNGFNRVELMPASVPQFFRLAPSAGIAERDQTGRIGL